MSKIIAKFTNEYYGIESYVVVGDKGFNVSIKDTDADEFIPMVKIYKNKEKAIEAAKKNCE